MIRDELLAALPHLRRLPDRIDRILTLTESRRAARAQHRRRGRASHPAHPREPGVARRRRYRVPGRRRRCCSSPPTPARRSVATPGCSRSSATSVCSSARCSCSVSSRPSPGTGRHDPTDQSRPRSHDHDVGGRRPTPPPGRRVSATSGTPATSSASSCRAAVAPAPGAVRRAGDADQRGVSSDLGRAAAAVPDAARGAPARGHADRRHRVPGRWWWWRSSPGSAGGGSAWSCSPPAPAPRCSRCSTPCFDIGGPRPRRGHRRHLGAHRRTSRRWSTSPVPARSSPPGSRGCRRSWRRCADLSLLVLVVVLAVAGTAGVPELLVAVAAGVTAGAAVLVAARRTEPPADPGAVVGALRAGGLAVDRSRARAGRRRSRAALHRDARRRRPRVRQGLRTRQPRRRPPLPRLPHRCCCAARTTTGPR